MKMMGFNAIRFFCSVPARYQLDLCDELGFMIYEESFAGWFLADSPQMKERFDHEISDMIRRDRNHPCVVMWGLLNETPDGPVFRHAVGMLPLVRSLDDTRVVMLNSGRFDGRSGQPVGGSMSGISIWQDQAGALEPNVTYNGTQAPISALGVLWEPGRLSLHPGPAGEYCVVRWTAPADGTHSISARFISIAEKATTDVHVLHSGKPIFDGRINLEGQGMQTPFAADVSVKAGDTLDFVVGWGNGHYGADSTGVEIGIRSADGKTFDAAREFSVEKNPSGVWSYGRLQPGVSPDASTFHPYDKGRLIGDPTEAREVIGSLANPGSSVWEDVVSDQHPYQRVPHTAAIIRALRTVNGGKSPVFISEYGIGSSLDLVRMTRDYEQLGAEHVEDARWYRTSWTSSWRLEAVEYGGHVRQPRGLFRPLPGSHGTAATAEPECIRANPNCVGHSMTGTTDCGDAGEGIVTLFRRTQAGHGRRDRRRLGSAPLVPLRRAGAGIPWQSGPSGGRVGQRGRPQAGRVSGASSGSWSQCAGVFDKTIKVTIPDPAPTSAGLRPAGVRRGRGDRRTVGQVPFPGLVPAGRRSRWRPGRVLRRRSRGAAGGAGRSRPVERRPGLGQVARRSRRSYAALLTSPTQKWDRRKGTSRRDGCQTGGDSRLGESARAGRGCRLCGTRSTDRPWLDRRLPFSSGICPRESAGRLGAAGWERIAGGPAVVALPQGRMGQEPSIFEGLPAGDLMDYMFYRDIIPDTAWVGQDLPAEVVAGAINTSIDYSAGLTSASTRWGPAASS